MDINLSSLESETRCSVCLGIVKSCRLVSGCMHRFCADCIEKWLRVASEPSCPQCRVQMQSRRDCKRDARFDRLLKLLYTNLRSYEAQVYDPKAEVLQEARKTGHALATAAAAQRAKRAPAKQAKQRKPPTAPQAANGSQAVTGGMHAATDGNSPYAVIAPSSNIPKVNPVVKDPQRSPQKTDKLRSDSPSPAPGAAASAAAASRSEPPPPPTAKQEKGGKRAASSARSSGQPKKQRTGQTPEPSKQPSLPVNMADAERKAAREAKSVAAAAASAAASERQHTSPMVEVHLHRQQSMASLIEEADITLLCPTGLTFGQMSQLLSQRHVSLRGRQVFYRVRNPSQQSVAASTVLESETVGSLAARQPNCRQDLHVEFVATTAGGSLS